MELIGLIILVFGGVASAITVGKWVRERAKDLNRRRLSPQVRNTHLDELLAESRGRCLARWQAAGVARSVALELTNDPDVGRPPPSVMPTTDRPLSVVVGDFGIGKSLVAERIFQHQLERLREGSDSAVPVHLPAGEVRKLKEEILAGVGDLGSAKEDGVFVVVDGADEAGASEAQRLLNEARALTESWPWVRVLITSRPLPALTTEETVRLPLMTEEDAYELVGRLAQRAVSPAMAHSWPQAVRDAIRRPLFAIMLAGYMERDSPRAPRSTADLLSDLVERAFSASKIDVAQAYPTLCRIASAVVERGGGRVDIREFSEREVLEALPRTGLTEIENGTISFALPILTQWFAAHALKEDYASLGQMSPQEYEKWRYPLIIATGVFSHETVRQLLEPVIASDPGFAAQIVDEAVAKPGTSEDVAAPPVSEAEARLRDAMTAWTKALGPLAGEVAPVASSGALLPVGARSDGPWLTSGWHKSDDQGASAPTFPAGSIFGGFRHDWIMVRSARPGGQPAWAWRWTLDSLVNQLYRVLDSRNLSVSVPALQEEEDWYFALALLGKGSLAHEPILLSTIRERLSRHPSTIVLHTGRERLNLPRFRARIQELEAAGVEQLVPPHSTGDRKHRSGWIWGDYSNEQLLKRTRSVFKSALTIYEALVREWFPLIGKRLPTASLLPAVLVGDLQPPKEPQEHISDGPGISWMLKAVPKDDETTVDIQLNTSRVNFREFDWDTEVRQLRALRPEAAEWIRPQLQSSVLDVFGGFPAREMAYHWLARDLNEVEWLDRPLGIRY